MDKKITINDIAAKAGVSKTTISRYLNDKFDNMSKTTKVRIEETIAELDYRPNRQAQALKARNSFLIGVSVADISNMYTSRLLKGIGDYFQKTHYQVLIMNADNNIDRELSNLEKMMTEQVDGIILQPLVHQPDHYQFLINKKTPVVQVDRYTEPFTWPAVVSDNFQKSVDLAKIFKTKHYDTVIVLANRITGVSSRMNRYNGLKAGLTGSQITVHLIEIDDSNWQSILKTTLATYQRTALFALNGQVLWSVVRFLKTQQIRVPEDIGLIGYDDDQFADMISPAIASISQNPQEIGRTAAEKLNLIINEHGLLPKNIRIPSTIQLRDSL
ncbi:LacI family DNA-binding transcriptional regulator [Leuconostoc gelidum subsp. gasicomitatum]|uniref:LacI family DNA-binding transcriptional regulator n=1 Tax=Leuconostoc gasicomitatum TaxID=115778 RepID=UPI001CC46CA3|nr:LacI family DNA-binding transcriptional regulator [Leuconostoc gasicomitatum]MBZ5966567.1 LacI family DNA-binding transcriptional regulator [Leuconostoc gasicomitatum]